MKKLLLTITVLFLSFNLFAQYKKASFFEKEGRTYELGSQIYMMGKGNGSPIGYKLAFGRDRDGKQLFKSWNIQYIPSHQYSYTTVDENEAPIKVSGHSKATIVYGLNYGYHLLKNKADQKRPVQPYVNAGLNILISSGFKYEEVSPDPYGYPKRQTSEQTLSIGLNGGLGCIFNLNSKLSLKAEGGYDHQFSMSTMDWDAEVKSFFVFDSHTYASLGVRLRIATE
ncbi:MAG: hypothetical protein ACJ75F_08435 [Flavisolibacter sp.]